MAIHREEKHPLIGLRPSATGDMRWKLQKDTDEEA